MIGLNRDREELYRRIELRVEKMFRQGLIDEVRDLIELGFNSDLKPLKTLGYKQTFGYLAGEYDLDTAISLTKQATRRYAKRQLTWFRRDPRIRWFTLTGDACHDHTCSEIEGYICRTIPIHVE
jgi:tRNA dimethylallyltransferase